MANDNKHRAVWAWLMGCPHIRDLFFNCAQSDGGDAALVPSESVLQEYIDGSSLRSYDVALTRVAPCSFEPNDAQNIDQLAEFEQLKMWIEAQRATGCYPAFPEGEIVQEIALLPCEGGFVAAQDARSCKYMLQFRIEYLKKG